MSTNFQITQINSQLTALKQQVAGIATSKVSGGGGVGGGDATNDKAVQQVTTQVNDVVGKLTKVVTDVEKLTFSVNAKFAEFDAVRDNVNKMIPVLTALQQQAVQHQAAAQAQAASTEVKDDVVDLKPKSKSKGKTGISA